ncbi:amidohydrolase [Stipitochalara longipes BDJ]|nr:amidohydrolase [Stipitochalara longipes BDJ]
MNTFLQSLRSPLVLLSKLSWRQSLVTTKPKPIASSRSSSFERIPFNSWDSHMHVVDPVKYPLAKDAQYVPKQHLLAEALRFESTVRIRNIVLIQPSIYNYDNSCMLDALRLVGPQRARAVVAFDPSTTTLSTLQEWHSIGVRGVRVNLHSVGKSMDASQLDIILHQYADMIRPLNWVLQLHVSIAATTALEKTVPHLGVRVCLDHFAQPALPKNESPYSTTSNPYLLPGFKSLVNLLEQKDTFVKMSAPYRISKETDLCDLEPVAKELLRVAGRTRIVFATDWPHTRFEGLDIRPFIEKVLEWCGEDEALIERLFKSNAEDLWDVRV